MKKYLAGGKAMAGAGACVKEDCSQTSQAFSAMLASRDKQMADIWKQPSQEIPLTQTQTSNTQLVLQQNKPVQQNKQADINTILDGDY